MLKKEARLIKYEDFIRFINEDIREEIKKMNLTDYNFYRLFKDSIDEFIRHEEDDDIGNIEDLIRFCILDYTDELLAQEFSKYDPSWEEQAEDRR